MNFETPRTNEDIIPKPPEAPVEVNYELMDPLQLESDPVARPILQEKALEYLKTEDKQWFQREFTGELTKDGYLIGKNGSANTLPSQAIGGGIAMEKVLRMTREALVTSALKPPPMSEGPGPEAPGLIFKEKKTLEELGEADSNDSRADLGKISASAPTEDLDRKEEPAVVAPESPENLPAAPLVEIGVPVQEAAPEIQNSAPVEKPPETPPAEVPVKEQTIEAPASQPETPPVEEVIPAPQEIVVPVLKLREEEPTGPESEKTLVETLRQKFGVDNVLDSAKIAYNGMLAGWYEKKSEEKASGIVSLEEKIRAIEKDAAHVEKELKGFRADGNISEKTLLKIESDKQKIESSLGSERQRLVAEKSSLDLLGIDHKTFVAKRNESCRTYTERTRTELKPFEERLSDLSATRDQLQSEIVRDREILGKRREELAKLAAKVEAEKFPSLRRATREIIKRIETEAGVFEKEISDREKHTISIDKEIYKATKRAQPLQEKCAELERISKGKEPKAARQQQRKETVKEQPISLEPLAEKGVEAPQITPESEPIYAEDELISVWNEVNGSKMLINPDTFKKNTGRGRDHAPKPISVDDFWTKASVYSARFGDQEKMAGMPDMKKAAGKKGSFWRWLFGLGESRMGKKRLLENLKMKKGKPKEQAS